MKLKKFLLSFSLMFGIMLVVTLVNNQAKADYQLEFDTEEQTGSSNEYHYYLNDDGVYELDLATDFTFNSTDATQTHTFKFDQSKVIVNVSANVTINESTDLYSPCLWAPNGEIIIEGEGNLTLNGGVGIEATTVTINGGNLNIVNPNSNGYYGIHADDVVFNGGETLISYPVSPIIGLGGHENLFAFITINDGNLTISAPDNFADEYYLYGEFISIYDNALILGGDSEDESFEGTTEDLNACLDLLYMKISHGVERSKSGNLYYEINSEDPDNQYIVLTGLVDSTVNSITLPNEIESLTVKQSTIDFTNLEVTQVIIDEINADMDYSFLQNISTLTKVRFNQTEFDDSADYSWITTNLDNATVTLAANSGTKIEEIATANSYNFEALDAAEPLNENVIKETVEVDGESKDVVYLAVGSYKSKLEQFLTDTTNAQLKDNNGNTVDNTSVLGSKYTINLLNSGKQFTVIVKGDISGNGECKIYDAFQILKGVLASTSLNPIDTKIRDYNDDNKVAIYDAFQFLKQALK